MVLKHPTDYQKGKTMVYFVRHGNMTPLTEGQSRHPGPGLSYLGKRQAKTLAKEFSKKKDEIDVLYSSTMTRALETAKEIGKSIHKKPIIEYHLSEFERILETRRYYRVHYWKEYLEFLSAKKTLNNILRKHTGKVIVIVAHGRLIRSLVGWKHGLSILQSSLFHHQNCHVTLVRFKGTKLDYIHYFNSKGLA